MDYRYCSMLVIRNERTAYKHLTTTMAVLSVLTVNAGDRGGQQNINNNETQDIKEGKDVNKTEPKILLLVHYGQP